MVIHDWLRRLLDVLMYPFLCGCISRSWFKSCVMILNVILIPCICWCTHHYPRCFRPFLYACLCVCRCTSACVCVSVCACVCGCVCMGVCACPCVHASTHAYKTITLSYCIFCLLCTWMCGYNRNCYQCIDLYICIYTRYLYTMYMYSHSIAFVRVIIFPRTLVPS